MSDDAIYAACPIRSQLDFGEQLEHTWATCNICSKLKQKAEAAAAASVPKPQSIAAAPVEDEPCQSQPVSVPSAIPKSVPAPAGWYDAFSGARPLPPPPPRGRGRGRGGQTRGCAQAASESVSKPSTSAPSTASNPKLDKLSNKARDRLDAQKFRKTNENLDKKKAALQVVQERRAEAQSQDKSAAPKSKAAVAPSDMPWVPNPHFLLPANSISELPIDDHRRYVAIISNFMRADASLRFEFNNIELESMDEKLKAEREKFVEYIRSSFETKGFYANAFSGSIKFMLQRMKTRINTLPQCGFNEIIKEIEWDPSMTAVKTMYVKKPQILSKGRSTKVSMPDPTRRCVLESAFDKISGRFNPEEAPKLLQDDQTAIEHAVSNSVTAVLTASSMRHLLSAPFPLRNYRRAFPMSIQRRFTNGRPERVIIIERPVPASGISKIDLVRAYGKYIVRSAIEKAPKVEAPVKKFIGVRPLKRKATDQVDVEEKKVKLDESVATVDAEKTGATDTDVALVIADETDEKSEEIVDKPEDSKEVSPVPAQSSDSLLNMLLNNKPSKSTEIPVKTAIAKVDVLDSILGDMEVDNTPVSTSAYSYSVIPIDEKAQHRVLVRSRAHNKDDFGNSFSLSTKLEYIPKCGAEELFEEELIWNALTAMLRGSDIHGLIHVMLPEAHCLQVHLSRSQKVFDALPVSVKEKLSGRWNRLFHLLEAIKDLTDGDYLLVEAENNKLQIFSEAISENDATWSRSKILEKSGITSHDKIYNESIDFTSKFNGIDTHKPLSWHVVKGRIPGSLLPPNPNRPAYQYNDRGRGRGRGRGNFQRGRGNQRGRGRGGRGHGRGRGRGAGGDRSKVVYTDHDANPFQLFDS